MKTRADLIKVDNVFEKNEVYAEKKSNIFSRFFSDEENIILTLVFSLSFGVLAGGIWGFIDENRVFQEKYEATIAPKMLNAQLIKEYKDRGKTLSGLGWTYESPDKLMKASTYNSIYGDEKENVEFILTDKVKLKINRLDMYGIERVESQNCDGVCSYVIKDENGKFSEMKRIDLTGNFENYSLLEFKDNVLINEYPLPSLKEYNLGGYFVHKNVGGEDYESLLNELETNRKFFLK